MKQLIQKADVLIEAMPYIQQFRDAIVVVKFGGSAMENKECCKSILTDVAFMECVGMKPVIVHGGGKAITKRMQASGIRPAFVKGLRVTDEASIRIVEDVLTREINPHIVSILNGLGSKAQGIPGQTILKAEKHFEKDDKTGQSVDIGFVGEVSHVDVKPIKECLGDDRIPVITPIGSDGKDHLYNINADNAAAAVAKALKARKLVFLSDVPGLLKNPSDPDSILSTLKVGEVGRLVRSGIIDGGMLPKIRGGMDALSAGVKKVHVIDGRLPHSLLLEIFTDKGIGTEIVHNE